MKRLIITIAIIACTFAAMAQNKIFEKYAKMEDVDYVCINKAMFNLANSVLDAELSNLGGIEKMLIISSNTAKGKSQIDKDIEVLSNDKNYEILMTARDGSDNVVFFFTDKRNPHELIIATQEKEESSIIVYAGNFSSKEVFEMLNGEGD
ncbi:MAG: DUF4252 domain-containing protein [Bacteroidales bacterium]|nr:DUF4252 domain-containing protein [Bacteroidales bacterium]